MFHIFLLKTFKIVLALAVTFWNFITWDCSSQVLYRRANYQMTMWFWYWTNNILFRATFKTFSSHFIFFRVETELIKIVGAPDECCIDPWEWPILTGDLVIVLKDASYGILFYFQKKLVLMRLARQSPLVFPLSGPPGVAVSALGLHCYLLADNVLINCTSL